MGKQRLHRTGVAIAVFGLVAAASAVIAAPAQASHGRKASTGVLDSANWRVCVSGIAELHEGVAHAVAQINRTDVNATYADCHSGDPNLTTFDVNSPETWLGVVRCLTGVVNGRCSRKNARFNNRTIASITEWRKVACHEFGHVAGLDHRDTNASCMTTGFSPPVAPTYDNHDIAEINATY